MLAFNDVKPANAARDVHTCRFAFFGRNLQAGHANGEVGRRQSQLDEPAHFLKFFFLHPFERIEILYFARDAARESRGVKVCDRSDAAAAPGDISPCFVGSNAASTDKSDTGNHYTAAQNGFSCGKEMRPELFLA